MSLPPIYQIPWCHCYRGIKPQPCQMTLPSQKVVCHFSTNFFLQFQSSFSCSKLFIIARAAFFFCNMRTSTARYQPTNTVTRLGDFLELLATNSHAKVAQMFGDLLGQFWKPSLFNSIFCGYFLGSFCKTWATFYSHIWTRCNRPTDQPSYDQI